MKELKKKEKKRKNASRVVGIELLLPVWFVHMMRPLRYEMCHYVKEGKS